MAQYKTWNPTLAMTIALAHSLREGGLIPALHELQAVFGHIPPEAIPLVAEIFNLSRAEVHGVVSFYHDFRTEGPPGAHVLKLCRAEACKSQGADKLADHVRARTDLDWGETRTDQRLTLEPIFCLGLCAMAPAAMIDGKPRGRVTEDWIDKVLEGEVGL